MLFNCLICRIAKTKSYQFLKCDVTSWQDQLAVFKAAIANSPEKSLDVVIANAGIGGNDSVFQLGTLLLQTCLTCGLNLW